MVLNMEISITTLAESKENFLQMSQNIIAANVANQALSSVEPIESVIEAMKQFFDIAMGVESMQEQFADNDISDIGEHGLSILQKLMMKTDLLQLSVERKSLDQIALVIADWIIQRDGIINLLEPIVDALAQVANSITEQQQLIALVDFMSEIIEACSDTIKQDMEMSDMHRPWRVLHINRGIVATRSNDPATMRRIFAELITALPMDAPNFFKEGMSEMVRLNYPEQVRNVMQEFFDKTDKPQIH